MDILESGTGSTEASSVQVDSDERGGMWASTVNGKSKGMHASSEPREDMRPPPAGNRQSFGLQRAPERTTVRARILGFEGVWSKKHLEKMYDKIRHALPAHIERPTPAAHPWSGRASLAPPVVAIGQDKVE